MEMINYASTSTACLCTGPIFLTFKRVLVYFLVAFPFNVYGAIECAFYSSHLAIPEDDMLPCSRMHFYSTDIELDFQHLMRFGVFLVVILFHNPMQYIRTVQVFFVGEINEKKNLY